MESPNQQRMDTTMDNQLQFRKFGTMLDCSRNAVSTVDSVKQWIDLTADMGYNCLMLYTEDTWEVDDNPYFGYMRGRYTQAELKELDAYALSKGMELIPCIQVLAHMGGIQRWPEYWPHFDTDDILLIGDPRIEDLIEKMFATIDKCFTTKTVHIGMDEAHMVGRGRYYDQHGEQDHSQVMIDHLNKVCEIGKKYGFNFLMWSDMFIKLVTGGEYYTDADISDEIRQQIPENVQLVYWDYYSTEKEHYDDMLHTHQKIKPGTWFAGGIWTWAGFAPHNGYSMKAIAASEDSCKAQGIQDAIYTLWGDWGGECSKFSLLPATFFGAEYAKGNRDMEDIKAKFQEKFGISFDDFMLLDLPGTPNGEADHICNGEKYLLYNDCFLGILDKQVFEGEGAQYAACAKALEKMAEHPQWGYLFATQKALCHALEIKAELGVRTRKIYHSGDKEALPGLIADYLEAAKRVKAFLKTYRKQWFIENKPHGFDVQDIRIGGVITRLESAADRLQDLYDGIVTKIDELEEEQLDFLGQGDATREPTTWWSQWHWITTPNVMADIV